MNRWNMRLDDVWRLMLPVIGVNRDTAWVELDDEALTFRYGWFEEQVPLAEVEAVEAMSWPWYYGVGLRIAPGRTLGLVGSTQEVVAVGLRRPRSIKVPFEMKFVKIAASIERHQDFIEELQGRLEGLKQAPR